MHFPLVNFPPHFIMPPLKEHVGFYFRFQHWTFLISSSFLVLLSFLGSPSFWGLSSFLGWCWFLGSCWQSPNFGLRPLFLGTGICCFEIYVENDQPSDRFRYRGQYGSWPNHKNTHHHQRRHFLKIAILIRRMWLGTLCPPFVCPPSCVIHLPDLSYIVKTPTQPQLNST